MTSGVPGRRIIQASWAGTAVFTVSAVVPAIVLGWLRYVAVAVDLVLFALGCIAFLGAYGTPSSAAAPTRSASAGLFFLAGKDTAPGPE